MRSNVGRLANDDAKTRLTNKAVKKKSVAELETRLVKAVKKRADFDVFRDVQRVSVLKCGGLRNSAGEKNQGWVLDDVMLDEPAVWLSLRGETVGSAMARLFQAGMSGEFEVLSARGVEGVMRMNAAMVVNPLHPAGTAELRGPRGDLVAHLEATPSDVRALGPQARPLFQWKQRGDAVVLQHQYRVLATIASHHRGGHEVSFEAHATPEQKFVVCCATAFFSHWSQEGERVAEQMDRRFRRRFDF